MTRFNDLPDSLLTSILFQIKKVEDAISYLLTTKNLLSTDRLMSYLVRYLMRCDSTRNFVWTMMMLSREPFFMQKKALDNQTMFIKYLVILRSTAGPVLGSLLREVHFMYPYIDDDGRSFVAEMESYNSQLCIGDDDNVPRQHHRYSSDIMLDSLPDTVAYHELPTHIARYFHPSANGRRVQWCAAYIRFCSELMVNYLWGKAGSGGRLIFSIVSRSQRRLFAYLEKYKRNTMATAREVIDVALSCSMSDADLDWFERAFAPMGGNVPPMSYSITLALLERGCFTQALARMSYLNCEILLSVGCHAGNYEALLNLRRCSVYAPRAKHMAVLYDITPERTAFGGFPAAYHMSERQIALLAELVG